jgi:dihydrofolate reductase
MMTVKAILACDSDWGIGKDGGLPWPHNPADLKWFKQSTLNHTVVMGKATWDSLPVKPLPNRVNVVVSSSDILAKVDVLSISDLRRRLSSMDSDQDVWIIGGARLIESMMDYIDEFHLSQINGTYNCDTFLPSTLIQENYSLTSSQFQGDVYVDIWSKR